jgi:competence protein ComEC
MALGAELGGRVEGPSLKLLASAAFLALVTVLLRRRRLGHLSALAAFLLAGAGLARLEASVHVPSRLQEGGSALLEGDVESLAPGEDGVTLQLTVSSVHGLGTSPLPVRFGARLFAPGEPPWTTGQRLLLSSSLKPLQTPGNWGEADFTEVWRRRGVRFTGTVDPKSVLTLSPPRSAERWLWRERRALGARAQAFAPRKEAAALFATLACGLRSELGREWEERFAQSGLAHVLSVSGLHVAALAVATLACLRFLLVRLWRRARGDVRRVAALASLPPLWAYVLFTGTQAAAVRSAVMATVAYASLAVWRSADALNSLAFAALVLLAVDPASVRDLSLQMSFAAVLGLILLTRPLRDLIPLEAPRPEVPGLRGKLLRAREAALQTLCASVAVTLAGAPLVAASFHRLSLAGLVSNILCLPLCGALSAVSALAAATFVLAPALSVPFLWLGGWLSQLLLLCADRFARLPGAALPAPSLGPLELSALLVGLGALAFASGRRRWLFALAPLALASLFLPRPRRDVSVTFLSVGQGDSIVIEAAGQTALIDGGGVPQGADPGERVVVPYLRERRIRGLALAALSHPHPDHALGLITALRALPTERLWLPAGNLDGPLTSALVSAAQGARVEEVETQHAPLRLGPATLSVWGPPQDRLLLKGVNDRSLVLKLTHGDVSFLFPGDLEAAGEEHLDPGPITVLKAPHHGSSTSSTPALLAHTHPRHVVFCVGAHNRFHFPHTPVVERYLAQGSQCFRTDLDGAVRFTSDGHSVRVERFRFRDAGTPARSPG